jgi:hypothetical protein
MPDDDTKKKKFNPFLAPTEHEDEAKLDEEEEDKPAPVANNDEEEGGEEGSYEVEEEGEIIVQNPDEGGEIYEEELVDEMSAESPQKQKIVSSIVSKPRSWSFYALGLLIVLVVSDWLVQSMGTILFWTPRSVYLMSYVLRTVVLLSAAYAWHRSLFRDNRSAFRAVFVWLGLLSGVILAILRFAAGPSFWGFINMVIEPLDSTILALATWYIVAHLTTKLKVIQPVRELP